MSDPNARLAELDIDLRATHGVVSDAVVVVMSTDLETGSNWLTVHTSSSSTKTLQVGMLVEALRQVQTGDVQ